MVMSFFRRPDDSGIDHIEAQVQRMVNDARHTFDLAMNAITGGSVSSVAEEVRRTDRQINITEMEIRRELVVHFSVHAGGDAAHAGIDAIEALWDRIGTENPAGEFVIAVDDDVRLDDLEGTFFRWLANADPARDRIQRGPRIGFDARRKTPGRDDRDGVPVRDYPPLVSMSPEIVDRVDDRWREYGFKGDPAPSRFAAPDR